MIESVGVKEGTCIKGVPTPNGEVYIPPASTTTDGMKTGVDRDEEDDVHEDSTIVPGKLEYDALRDCIHSGGMDTKAGVEHSALSTIGLENVA